MTTKNQDRIIHIITFVFSFITHFMPNRMNCAIMGWVYDSLAHLFPTRFFNEHEWSLVMANKVMMIEEMPTGQHGEDYISDGEQGILVEGELDMGSMGKLWMVEFDCGITQLINVNYLTAVEE